MKLWYVRTMKQSLTIDTQERIKVNYNKLRNYLSHNQIKLRKGNKKGGGIKMCTNCQL